MQKRWKVLIGVCVVGVVGMIVSWLAPYFVTYGYHYKLCMELEVNGKPVVGSSVMEITAKKQPLAGFDSVGEFYGYQKGEGIFLDLGEGRNVVMTLIARPDSRVVFSPMSLLEKVFDCPSTQMFVARNRPSGRHILPEEYIPAIVTFTNPKDPSTLRLVKPKEFEKVFGADVHFKQAWIEMTQDNAIPIIEKYLPWAKNYESVRIANHLIGRDDRELRGDQGGIFSYEGRRSK